MPQKNHKLPEFPFLMLVVLDGWGLAEKSQGNAIARANTKTYDRLCNDYPMCRLDASGHAVGLPRGEVGNTETGHLNLGAGRIIYQDLARINMSIADGSFYVNDALVGAIKHTRLNGSCLHLLGLVGAGGVHSNIEHLFALIHMAAKQKVEKLFLHVITDGRDSPPKAAIGYIEKINQVLKTEGVGKIASVMGRYWAMDRDQRWDRTAKAYFALTKGEGDRANSAEEAIKKSYKEGKTDEFIPPTIILDSDENALPGISDQDAVIFYNYRVDRPRQLTSAFVLDESDLANRETSFDPYAVKYEKKHIPDRQIPPVVMNRGTKLKDLYFVMMTEYDKNLAASGTHTAFPPEKINMTMGKVLSLKQMKQLRAAESEKERFVTYYFNGQLEKAFYGEDRLIIPSPGVATYDIKPEMSSFELTESVVKMCKANTYNFVLINYAAPDMVGHTGNIQAATIACQAVDKCLKKLLELVTEKKGVMVITGDHGNVENMLTENGEVNTEHSNSPVPFITVAEPFFRSKFDLRDGILADVAPTCLELLGIDIPEEMSGSSLFSFDYTS